MKKEKYGKYYYSDSYYIGPLLNGLPSGKGKLYYKNGNIKYEGDFVDDKREGKGKYIYEERKDYIGKMLNGFINGIGAILKMKSIINMMRIFILTNMKWKGKNFLKMGNII
jgi:hypothetical protein